MSSSTVSSGRPGYGSRVLAAFDQAQRPYAGVAARVAARLVAQEDAAGATGDPSSAGQGEDEL
ncbi:hypothetical protein [Kitasatospora viridis]|uniref:Uncharacterized protein n=1 Tax=Kitasatospora viridis TaxID=281105 RepID=A0A561TTE9_9ACTN|nr:hypothetical protein [Kitasatospora viridis]TWF90385.1 hypothetical protein FHX73_13429 [Kitasatospora viridis]